MSKPLTIFLELVGGIILIAGILKGSPFPIVLGGIMFIAGAIGIRKRLKSN